MSYFRSEKETNYITSTRVFVCATLHLQCVLITSQSHSHPSLNNPRFQIFHKISFDILNLTPLLHGKVNHAPSARRPEKAMEEAEEVKRLLDAEEDCNDDGGAQVR